MNTSPVAYYSLIRGRLEKLKTNLVSRGFTAGEFTNIIRRQFSATDFIFRTQKDTAVDPDQIIVSGLYDPFDDSEMLPSITIALSYHPAQTKYFVQSMNWEQFCFDVIECIGHEMVHKHQQNSGRKSTLKKYNGTTDDQCYLGGEDEIEAYGFSIAAEMIAFNKTITECVMYGVYSETFSDDSQIIKKLEKEVKKYKQELEKL